MICFVFSFIQLDGLLSPSISTVLLQCHARLMYGLSQEVCCNNHLHSLAVVGTDYFSDFSNPRRPPQALEFPRWVCTAPAQRNKMFIVGELQA